MSCFISYKKIHLFPVAFQDVGVEKLQVDAVEKIDYEEGPPVEVIRAVPQEDSLYAQVITTFRRLVKESTMSHNLY